VVTAAEFGRNTGAGITVFGTIVGVGSDSVRVVATMLGVARGEPLAEIELRDRADRLDRLADSLAVRLLGDLGRTQRVSATPMYSIGSGVPAAIKAFLRGEQHYRRSDWDSARVYYEQAVQLDSSFAMAHRRLGIVLGWDALEAAEILRQMSQLESAPSPLDVIWVLERARVNERLGNHEKAIRDYSYVLDVWRSADALLQPFVDEARTAVTRLAGEPRR